MRANSVVGWKVVCGYLRRWSSPHPASRSARTAQAPARRGGPGAIRIGSLVTSSAVVSWHSSAARASAHLHARVRKRTAAGDGSSEAGHSTMRLGSTPAPPRGTQAQDRPRDTNERGRAAIVCGEADDRGVGECLTGVRECGSAGSARPPRGALTLAGWRLPSPPSSLSLPRQQGRDGRLASLATVGRCDGALACGAVAGE